MLGLWINIMFDESFWNKVYANDAYIYGTEPNSFLAEHCSLLKGLVLSLSEGEGRNGMCQWFWTTGLKI